MKHALLFLAIIAILIAIWVFAFKGQPEKRSKDAAKEAVKPKEPPKPKFKELVESYDDGSPKLKYSVFAERPEVKQGLCTEFYKAGKRKAETSYVENAPQGRYSFYYEDGSKAMEGELKAGKRNGKFTEWHPSGRVKIDASYKDGLIDGAWFEYYDSEGSPKKIEAFYIDGALAGRYALYKADGLVKEERNYGRVPEKPVQQTQPGDAAPGKPHDCSDAPTPDLKAAAKPK